VREMANLDAFALDQAAPMGAKDTLSHRVRSARLVSHTSHLGGSPPPPRHGPGARPAENMPYGYESFREDVRVQWIDPPATEENRVLFAQSPPRRRGGERPKDASAIHHTGPW